MRTYNQERLLRVKEAAELLGVSPNTVRAWGAAGKIPEYRHPANSYRLYRRQELEQFLHRIEASRREGGSQSAAIRGNRR